MFNSSIVKNFGHQWGKSKLFFHKGDDVKYNTIASYFIAWYKRIICTL